MNAKSLRWILAWTLSALAVWACTQGIVPATGERRFLGFTWEQEIALGKQASKEIAQAFGLYQDPRLERYVQEVGQRVLRESHLRRPEISPEIRNTPITFRILDSPTVNAMAIPGGYVYVTRGLLAHLNSEDQLAVVLGHELGHIAARHAARRAWQQQLGQGLLLGGAILGQQVLGLPAQQILDIAGTAAQLIFLRYSREDEHEADTLAVEYSALAGYDAAEAAGFFRALERIGEKENQGLPNFLSTHPNPGDRLERVQELASKWRGRRGEARPDSAAYLRAIEGLVLGEDPRQGFVERGVFYHPELRFRFPVPRGFRLINQPAQVVMLEGQRRAMIGFRFTEERSARSAAARFAAQGGLRVLETAAARSERLPAYAVLADARAQNGQVVRLLGYFVEHGGRVYQFLGYASPQAFRAFQPEFLRTMQGFGELQDPAKLDRRPVRLRLERVARAGPLRGHLPARLPEGFTPEEVAILNQKSLGQQIPPETILKLPSVQLAGY